MALLKRKFGAHLSDNARSALAACRSYAPPFAALNPLTRNLCRRLLQADWEATLSQIDFPYTLEDEQIGAVACVRYRTPQTRSEAPLILYIHASAFIAGSARSNAAAILPACHLSGCEGVGVDYSLAPEAVFPAQLEEIERVYLALSKERGPERIVLCGDSAGAGLALASMHRWRRKSIPLPAGAVLISAFADAAAASDTHVTLKHHDPIFNVSGVSGVATVFQLYAPGGDYSNPEISPLAGDFAGMPPLLIHVGSREVLLGDSARLAEKARRAGVDVTLRVFDGLFHLFHMHWSLDEVKAAFEDIAAFIAKTTGAPALRQVAASPEAREEALARRVVFL